MNGGNHQVVGLTKGLRKAAGILEVLAILSGIGGVLAGIAIAASSSTDYLGNSTHPFVVAGLAVACGSVVAAVFYWAIARALNVYAVDTALRNGEDIVTVVGTGMGAATSTNPAAADGGASPTRRLSDGPVSTDGGPSTSGGRLSDLPPSEM